MARYEIDEIKARNPPRVVAERLGLPLKGNRLVCRHPDHANPESYNCVALDRVYHCHSGSCGRTYDVIDMVTYVLRCGTGEAIRWLAEESGVAPAAGPDPVALVAASPARGRRTYRPPRLAMMEFLHEVAGLYERELWTWDGVKTSDGNPLAMLRARVKDDAVIRRLRGGYSPGADFLGDMLPVSRHALAVEAGLLSGKNGAWRRAVAARASDDRPGRDLTAGRTILWEYRHVRLPSGGVGFLPVWGDRRLVVDPPAWLPKDKTPPRYLGLALPRPLLGFAAAYGKGPYILVMEGRFKALAAERIGYPAVATGSSMFGEDIAGELCVLLEAATLLVVCDRDGGIPDERHPLPGPGRLGPGHRGFAHSFRKMGLTAWQRVVFVRTPPRYKGFDDFVDAEPQARALFDERAQCALRYACRPHPAPGHGRSAAADRNGRRYSPPSYTPDQLAQLWQARRATRESPVLGGVPSPSAGEPAQMRRAVIVAVDWWLAVLFDLPGQERTAWPEAIALVTGTPVAPAAVCRFAQTLTHLVTAALNGAAPVVLAVEETPVGLLAEAAGTAHVPATPGVWPPATTMEVTSTLVRVRIEGGVWAQIYPDVP